MLKNYELLYIVHPDLEGTTDKVTEKVTGFITKADGKILNQEDWGKRKLAYPIAHNDFGVYVLVEFEADSEKLNEIERNLRLSEEVMRSMVVTLPEEKEIPKAKSAKKAAKPAEEKIEAEVVEVEEEKKAEPVEEKAEEKPEEKEEKTKKAVAKKEEKPAKEAKKVEDKSKEEDEKDRLKKLDEKLEEILGEDKK